MSKQPRMNPFVPSMLSLLSPGEHRKNVRTIESDSLSDCTVRTVQYFVHTTNNTDDYAAVADTGWTLALAQLAPSETDNERIN